MLGLLKSRIDNTREQEIENAAREQGEITLLRIEKLLRQ
jgi:2-oxo-4-hydroxy-4-carboxy-5-ureidoimidazoline decarboxylase